jgi:hypothetical protein
LIGAAIEQSSPLVATNVEAHVGLAPEDISGNTFAKIFTDDDRRLLITLNSFFK